MTSLIQIILALLNIISVLVIFDVVLSWLIQFGILDRSNRLISQLWWSVRNLMEPLYSRVRRFLPRTTGIDLAPAALLFAIFAIKVIITNNFF